MDHNRPFALHQGDRVADAEKVTFVEGTEVVVLEAAALTVTPQGGSRALTRTTHLSTQTQITYYTPEDRQMSQLHTYKNCTYQKTRDTG